MSPFCIAILCYVFRQLASCLQVETNGLTILGQRCLYKNNRWAEFTHRAGLFQKVVRTSFNLYNTRGEQNYVSFTGWPSTVWLQLNYLNFFFHIDFVTLWSQSVDCLDLICLATTIKTLRKYQDFPIVHLPCFPSKKDFETIDHFFCPEESSF